MIWKQAQLDAGLQEANARMSTCAAELAELEEEVNRLKTDFGRRTAEAEALKQNLHQTQVLPAPGPPPHAAASFHHAPCALFGLI